MDLSFRPMADALENRDAPVILVSVPGVLTLFAIEGISFPSHPEVQRTDPLNIVVSPAHVPSPVLPPGPR